MELYLDSADVQEIRESFALGFLAGLTTTPTFMHRQGITAIDSTIIELSKIVPILQIEALGETAGNIIAEVHRQDKLGLNKEKTVYKIPASLEAMQACTQLRKEGFKINIHLVYTLQQAYMAMAAGASYVCPLVGRLQDQGHDALRLISECVDAVNYYGYDTKIMFSSVRNTEHVRNALSAGVHAITAPWKIIQQLAKNHFTDLGTRQFTEHTRLMTVKVKDAMNNKNPLASPDMTVAESLVEMTLGGFGAITIVDTRQKPIGIFTDGDLRRLIGSEGEKIIHKKMSELSINTPKSINSNKFLYEAANLLKVHRVDCLVVTENGKAVGMIDIQDMNE